MHKNSLRSEHRPREEILAVTEENFLRKDEAEISAPQDPRECESFGAGFRELLETPQDAEMVV